MRCGLPNGRVITGCNECKIQHETADHWHPDYALNNHTADIIALILLRHMASILSPETNRSHVACWEDNLVHLTQLVQTRGRVPSTNGTSILGPRRRTMVRPGQRFQNWHPFAHCLS